MMQIVASDASIILPSPLPQDRESLVINSTLRRSMNNVPYTYIKNTGRVRLQYKFFLRRGKAIELEQFVNNYMTEQLTVYDHKNNVFQVYLMDDSVDFSPVSRTEMTEVMIVFEGVQVVTADPGSC